MRRAARRASCAVASPGGELGAVLVMATSSTEVSAINEATATAVSRPAAVDGCAGYVAVCVGNQSEGRRRPGVRAEAGDLNAKLQNRYTPMTPLMPPSTSNAPPVPTAVPG